MKNQLTGLLLCLIGIQALAQDFNEQFYSERTENGIRTGVIKSVDDSLASIEFKGPTVLDGAYFACKYQFQGDTLFVKEILEATAINVRVEYMNSQAKRIHGDSLFILYQPYNVSGGWPYYADITFGLEGRNYSHNGLCDTYCASTHRPKSGSCTIYIHNHIDRIAAFDIALPDGMNAIYLTKEIFESSCCGAMVTGFDYFKSLIPDSIDIDGKSYVLQTALKWRDSEIKFEFDGR